MSALGIGLPEPTPAEDPSAIEADARTSGEIRAVLRKRWPDTEYVVMDEVPAGDPAQMGRKVDMVAISAWRSRGFAVDAVEIKVSVSDRRRELQDAAKADWWWRHADRFWVAVPSKMATKIADEVPETWGLLACTATTSRVVRQAQRHERAEMSWTAVVALLRCARGASTNALSYARSAGYDEGREAAKRELARQSGDAYLRKRLEHLTKAIDAFNEASGARLDEYSAADLGAKLGLVQSVRANPKWVRDGLERNARQLERAAKDVRELAKLAELEPEVTA